MNLSGTGVTNVKPGPGNGNSNARVLHQILLNNTGIETLVSRAHHAVPFRRPFYATFKAAYQGFHQRLSHRRLNDG